MDKRIIKYLLPLTADGGPEVDSNVMEVVMPAGSQIVSACMDNGRAVIWAISNVERKKMLRPIQVVGTNVPMHDASAGTYIGTLSFLDGDIFLHLFDLGEREWVMPQR